MFEWIYFGVGFALATLDLFVFWPETQEECKTLAPFERKAVYTISYFLTVLFWPVILTVLTFQIASKMVK